MVQLTYKYDLWWKNPDAKTEFLIQYVCENDLETVKLLIKYLAKMPVKLRSTIRQQLQEQKHRIKFLGMRRRRTTRNAIMLADRIRRELGCLPYPSIEVCATKGYMSSGCWRWAMRDLMTLTDIGSSNSVRQCLKKSNQLVLKSDEIYVEKIVHTPIHTQRKQRRMMIEILSDIYSDNQGRCPKNIDSAVWANLVSILTELGRLS